MTIQDVLFVLAIIYVSIFVSSFIKLYMCNTQIMLGLIIALVAPLLLLYFMKSLTSHFWNMDADLRHKKNNIVYLVTLMIAEIQMLPLIHSMMIKLIHDILVANVTKEANVDVQVIHGEWRRNVVARGWC